MFYTVSKRPERLFQYSNFDFELILLSINKIYPTLVALITIQYIKANIKHIENVTICLHFVVITAHLYYRVELSTWHMFLFIYAFLQDATNKAGVNLPDQIK